MIQVDKYQVHIKVCVISREAIQTENYSSTSCISRDLLVLTTEKICTISIDWEKDYFPRFSTAE